MLLRPPSKPVSPMLKRTGLLLAALLLAIALPALAEIATPTDLETPPPMVTPDPEPTAAPPTDTPPTDVPATVIPPTDTPLPEGDGAPPWGGGRPSFGGRPSGSRPSGSKPGGASSGEDAGFLVTPGQALAKTHASGDGDMTAYGALPLALDGESMTLLTLGGQTVDVSCDAAFTAAVGNAALTLAADACTEWRVTLAALDTLRISGIERVILQCAAWSAELDTSLTLTGSAYTRLRAQGYVAADFLLRVTAEGIAVDAAGETYRLHQGRLESEADRP